MANRNFAADLRIVTTEEVGPKLNSRSVNLLHPDMHQTSADLGRARITQRAADRVAYLPSNLENANNVYLKNLYQVAPDGTMEVRDLTDQLGNIVPGNGVGIVLPDGDQAQYLSDNYAHAVTEAPSSDKPLIET